MFRSRSAPKLILFFAVLVLLGVILVVGYSALSAANSVPLTRLGLTTQTIDLGELLPTDCSAITFDHIIYCTAGVTCYGTTDSDLIFGTSSADTIDGRNRADCILGGGGDDTIDGGKGQGNDVCIGGPGTDTFPNCETSIQ